MLKINNKYEILTPSGWQDFDGIQEIVKKGQTIVNINDNQLICSPLHAVFYKDDFLLAKDIPYAITNNDQEFVYYDLINVGGGNQYYTNGIISHNCEFMGSSGTLIAGWKLKQLVHQTPLLQKDGLYQFKTAEKDHTYVIICDVSRGKGLDYSTFSVLDVSSMPYNQVCTYRNNLITPMDFTDIIYRTAVLYNKASVLVEINDIGETIGTNLFYEFEYENILFTENSGRLGKKISTGFGGANIDKGIRTTKSVKAIGCAILKLLVEQNQLIINDFFTIEELSTFSRKGVSYEAEPGKHDDMVMTLVLFSWLTDQQYFKDITDINTMVKLRERTEEEIMSELAPFGYVDDGRDIESIIEPIGKRGNWLSVENDFL